jgi:hypothetical protein
MKSSNLGNSLLALSFVAVAACDTQEPAFGAGDVDERCTVCSGIKLNTNKIGLHAFSEIDTNGNEHDGVKLESVVISRGKLDKVTVENGQLIGKIGGSYYGGHNFDGSIWTLDVNMSDDPEHEDWVEAIMKITGSTNDPVYGWKYTFEHQVLGGPKEFYPNCDKDEDLTNGEQFDALVTGNITVADQATIVSRDDTIFIGCLSGGVGKAGYWGYPKHKVTSNERFTTAVRMVRGDYCGTGDSFTKVGTPVTVTDTWGFNSLVNNYKLEAVWGEKGAECLYQPRLIDTFRYSDVVHECEGLGGHIPNECLETDTLANYQGLNYLSGTP